MHFLHFFLSSGWLSESLPNFSSVTSKAIMYKRYKNASLSKILLTDYHSSPTQWSSVLLFISWAAVGGNIFRKVPTILFSFQIHFLRVFFQTHSFCYVCQDILFYLLFSCIHFLPGSLGFASEIHYVGFLWIYWSDILSLGRHFFDWCFSVLLYEKKIQSICFWISLVQKELKTIMVELFRYNFCFSLCLLNFWLYAIFLNFVTVLWSYLVWFAVFWLDSAILCLLIWLCIHFSPKSVLWQFSVVMVCTSLEFS